MAEISDITTQTQNTVFDIEDGQSGNHPPTPGFSGPLVSVSFVQKVNDMFVQNFIALPLFVSQTQGFIFRLMLYARA